MNLGRQTGKLVELEPIDAAPAPAEPTVTATPIGTVTLGSTESITAVSAEEIAEADRVVTFGGTVLKDRVNGI